MNTSYQQQQHIQEELEEAASSVLSSSSLNLMCDYTLADNHLESRRLSQMNYAEDIREENNAEKSASSAAKTPPTSAQKQTSGRGSMTTKLVQNDINMNHLNDLNDDQQQQHRHHNDLHHYAVNDEASLADANKYYNLGLSFSSQELVVDFYQILSNQDPRCTKSFEEVLASIIGDIQGYKNDASQLEQLLKSEREHNKELVKQMIDEADHQMAESCEKIRNEERENCDRVVAKLKEQFETETNILHENLTRLKKLLEKHVEEKTIGSQQMSQLIEELDHLREENSLLRTELDRANDKYVVCNTEIKDLTNEKYEIHKDIVEKTMMMDTHKAQLAEYQRELRDLEDEIKALKEENHKLTDSNEQLAKKIESMDLKQELKLDNHSERSVSRSESSSGFLSDLKTRSERTVESSIHSDSDNAETDEENTENANHLDSVQMETRQNEDTKEDEDEEEEEAEEVKSAKPESKSSSPVRPMQQKPTGPQDAYRILIAGKSGVGKTSFVTKYCTGEFPTYLDSTTGVESHKKIIDLHPRSIVLELIDTNGKRKLGSLIKNHLKSTDIIILMYDCTDERTFLKVREWIPKIKTSCYLKSLKKRIPIILVGNKADLRESCRHSNETVVVEFEDGLKTAKRNGTLFFETSAKMGTNMRETFLKEILTNLIRHQEIESAIASLETNISRVELAPQKTESVQMLRTSVEGLARENEELRNVIMDSQNINNDLLRQMKAVGFSTLSSQTSTVASVAETPSRTQQKPPLRLKAAQTQTKSSLLDTAASSASFSIKTKSLLFILALSLFFHTIQVYAIFFL